MPLRSEGACQDRRREFILVYFKDLCLLGSHTLLLCVFPTVDSWTHTEGRDEVCTDKDEYYRDVDQANGNKHQTNTHTICGRKDWPSMMTSVRLTPAMSSMVGARSILRTGALDSHKHKHTHESEHRMMRPVLCIGSHVGPTSVRFLSWVGSPSGTEQ